MRLKNVLLVPNITKNLLSIGKLADDLSCVILFSSKGFVVKDKKTWKTLASGCREGGLYTIGGNTYALFSTRQRTASDEVWHQRLGHPQQKVLSFLSQRNFISVDGHNKGKSICTSCQMGKSCKLPFINENTRSDFPLHKIHCDLWGPAPINSVQNFRYYVSFVDDCTCYTWMFPLKYKSDIFACFKKFKNMVELQHNHKIKVFQSNGGGEFGKTEFLNFLSDHGIVRQISCPRTP